MTVRILWGSPLPPIRSGVSDYAADLLPELAKRADVRLLRPPDWRPPPDWALAKLPVVAADTTVGPGELCLVHLGNNPYHRWLLPRLEGPRTVVVLHDPILHHLLVEATVSAGQPQLYRQWVVEAHGQAGEALAAAREVGITGRRDPFLFPARRPFLRHAIGVVVHSRWAAEQVAGDLPRLPVARVGLAVRDPGAVDRRAMRAKLGLSSEDVVLMHLGFVTAEKGIGEILAAAAAAVRCGVPVRLLLVGEGELAFGLRSAVSALSLEDRVVSTGWVDPDEMVRLPAAADLGVVLRTPSAGETSAAAVRFLACGTPVAVMGRRQFLELPEEAAPRLTPGPSASAELARLLLELAATREQDRWLRRRRAARSTYEGRNRPELVAESLIGFLRQLAG